MLFGELTDGVVVVDGDGQVVDANETAVSWFGDDLVDRSIEDAMGMTAEERAPSIVGDGATAVSTASGIANGSTSGTVRTTIETRDGTRVFDVGISELSRRGIDGTILLFRDVTDREELQRRYRALVEKSPNVILTVDDNWRISYVSPSVERILGFEPTTVVDRSFLEFVHPEDRAGLRDQADGADSRSEQGTDHAIDTTDSRDGPTQPAPIDHRIRDGDDRWRQFETTMRPLFDGEFVLTATDVTDQRRYEQRLQVLNRVLRHDLKNDMNVVVGYAELLEPHVDDEVDDYLEHIRTKAEGMLELSRQAREIDIALHSESDLVVFDAAQSVREAVEQIEMTDDDATIELQAPPTAEARGHRLYKSAIDNVLENAIEHNDRADPTVEVTVERRPDRVEVSVADDGPGIPSTEREVFETGEETALEHASGLGLWLVNWIVNQSGGELYLEENDPDGSIVRLEFPRADDADPPSSRDRERGAARSF